MPPNMSPNRRKSATGAGPQRKSNSVDQIAAKFRRRSPGPPDDSDQCSSSEKKKSPIKESFCARPSAAGSLSDLRQRSDSSGSGPAERTPAAGRRRLRSTRRTQKTIQAAPTSIVTARGALNKNGV